MLVNGMPINSMLFNNISRDDMLEHLIHSICLCEAQTRLFASRAESVRVRALLHRCQSDKKQRLHRTFRASRTHRKRTAVYRPDERNEKSVCFL
jgi:hypothetical protein